MCGMILCFGVRYVEMVRKHREFEARERKEKTRAIKLLNDMPGFLEKRYTKLGTWIRCRASRLYSLYHACCFHDSKTGKEERQSKGFRGSQRKEFGRGNPQAGPRASREDVQIRRDVLEPRRQLGRRLFATEGRA